MDSHLGARSQADEAFPTQTSCVSQTSSSGLLPYDGSWHVWEAAYKAACRRIDALLAENDFLRMELASSEGRNGCLTREVQRLNLTVRHLVRSTSTRLTFADNEQVPWGSATPPTSRDTSDAVDGRKEELQDEVKQEAEENKENMEPLDRMQTASPTLW